MEWIGSEDGELGREVFEESRWRRISNEVWRRELNNKKKMMRLFNGS